MCFLSPGLDYMHYLNFSQCACIAGSSSSSLIQQACDPARALPLVLESAEQAAQFAVSASGPSEQSGTQVQR